jgi:hypothetical protein
MINYFRMGGYALILGLLLGSFYWLSSKVGEYHDLKTSVISLKTNIKDKDQIIANQNNEIIAKDKFIENLEKKRNEIRIKKQITISKPLDEQYQWLLDNCTNKAC